MENFNIENAKTRFFESKEHYLKFRQAWKDFHNNRDHMRTVEWTDWKGNEHTGEVPVLNSSHYMLYNLLREYPAQYGFTEHGVNGWEACEYARAEILRAANSVKNINTPSEWSRKWARERIDDLLLPFGETLSESILVALAREIDPNFPEFEVQERQDFTKVDKKKASMSIAEKLKSWRSV